MVCMPLPACAPFSWIRLSDEFLAPSAGGLTLLNFVSNHDVIRLASVVKRPEHCVLATAALLLLHGIPCIYYGDEYGVEVRHPALPSRAHRNSQLR